MEKLMKTLDIHRTSFSRVYDATIVAMQLAEPDVYLLQSNLQILEQKIQTMAELDKKFIEIISESDSVEIDIDAEVEKADQYVFQFNHLKLKVENRLSTTAITSKDNHQLSGTQSQLIQSNYKLKLPTIEFQKLGGDIREWLPFWGQFKRIHDDENLENEDKFQYLIQATIPKSRARQVIESYPPTSENYSKAIDSLKSRFGRDDLLVEVYVRELLKLVLNNLNGKFKLNFLYDKIESHLRALETLGITSEKCAAMLYPLIESCLPEEILRVWQRSSSFCVEDSLKKRLEQLMHFLRKEVENEERIALAASGFDLQKNRKKENFDTNASIPTVSGLANTKPIKCVFCKKDHRSEDCKEAYKLTFSERRKILSEKGCCHVCLKFGHISRKCRSATYMKCKNCEGKHATSMCSKSKESETSSVPTENLSNTTYNGVFLQTLVVYLKGKYKSRYVRAIIDTGSERSYINKHTALDLELEQIRSEEMIHALFGGCHSDVIPHICYRVNLESLDKNYACSLEALDQSIICSNVVCIHEGPWMDELRDLDIYVTDNQQGPIEILFGADVAGKLLSGPRHVLKCGLVAIKTSLGWTLMGKVQNRSQECKNTSSMIVTTMLSRSFDIKDIWSLDILGIDEPNEKRTQLEHEQSMMNYFSHTVTRDETGRYQVKMPWIEGHPPLCDNFDLAKKRLDVLLRKLEGDGYYEEYDRVLKEWLSEDIIETVPENEMNSEAHYLPHRHVVKLNANATTKHRPVFDASANQKNQPSLNHCLDKGINLISMIPSILIGFRMSRIGIISDIKKAFLQIKIHENERNFLRFLWYDENGKLKHFRHARVVFGVTCSPFLLGAVIQHHLQNAITENCIEKPCFSENNILKLRKSFYVDNCITSVDSEKELHEFMKESQELMLQAQFDLRGWEHSNFNEQFQEAEMSYVLGLSWDKCSDTLRMCFDGFREVNTERITKRVILSVTNTIFDPLGFVSPVLLCPKILLQETWVMKLGWNEEVPEDTRKTFLSWLKELNCLSHLAIPRWFMNGNVGSNKKLSLHTFSDASKYAYSAIVFLRTESDSKVSIQLVQAKSRVSPIKKMSIPRLELLAATIGVRLLKSVSERIADEIETFFWTDSTTVLSWIRRKEKWKPFVWNRIQEINKYSRENSWFHVPGSLNPADLPSRGCSAAQLLKSRWWEGPAWLYTNRIHWPEQEYTIDEDLISEKKGKSITSLLSQTNMDFSWTYRYFSKYQKIVNHIGWMKRFIYNCKNPENRQNGDLSLTEVENAERYLLKCVQNEGFRANDDKISSLLTFTDEDGILKLKTKITEREDLREFRYPIVLPGKHPVVTRLIYDIHIKSLHVGTQGLLSILRERFWIVGGRKSVKCVISKCIVCRRFTAKRCESSPVCLPKDRVRDAAVFEITGVDMFGNLFLRNGKKVYVCIFTCAVYRAIHLELVCSLTTDSFFQAFRRFVARRGRPTVIYSDNGTNFTGAENALEILNWQEIQKEHTAQRMTWKFNPPSAAWWGGWWERLIRIVKQLLKKVLGKACLTFEELTSVLCDCEAIINSRPLTYVSEDESDLVTLSPIMFLQDIKEIGVPDIDKIEETDLRKRLRYRNRVRKDLRKRFRKEYLGQLFLRRRDNQIHNLKVGAVVLLEGNTANRIEWPLGRIEQMFTGKDGEIRLVQLKTSTGYLLRPIQKLFPLEMDMTEDETKTIIKTNSRRIRENQQEESNEVTTRSGRKIKPPSRYGM